MITNISKACLNHEDHECEQEWCQCTCHSDDQIQAMMEAGEIEGFDSNSEILN